MTHPMVMLMKPYSDSSFTLSYDSESNIWNPIFLISENLEHIYSNAGFITYEHELSWWTYSLNSLAALYNDSNKLTSLWLKWDWSSIFISWTSTWVQTQERSMSTNYAVSGTSFVKWLWVWVAYSQMLFWDSWNKWYITNGASTLEYNITTPYDLFWSKTLVNTETSLWFFQFNSDWTKLYTVTTTNLKEYNVWTAWDISTVTFNKDISLWVTLSWVWVFNLNSTKLIISTWTVVKIFNINS